MPYAHNGDVELYYETFGSPSDPTLLMINGLGSQSTNYKEELCQRFVEAGFQVIRFDNRDVGLSTHFHDSPVDPARPAYLIGDMADDAVAVLDAAGVEQAHVVGASMGGMIVQQLAVAHRHRLLTATSVMSRTGEAGYGQSTPEALAHLLAPPVATREAAIQRSVSGAHIWGSPAFIDDERLTTDAERAYDRCFDPAGVARQFMAIGASTWFDELPNVTTPMLVIHGDADALIDISGGRRTAEVVPGARLVEIEGMGHDYPPQLWDLLVAEIAKFALR